MVFGTMFPVNEGMQFVFSQPFIFLQLVIFSVIKIAVLFSTLIILEKSDLKNKYRKALFVASGTEGLNFILKIIIVLNFLNIFSALEAATGVSVDRIIFVPSILAIIFSTTLIKKTYGIKDGGSTFWYVWITLGTLTLLLGDLALILLLTMFA